MVGCGVSQSGWTKAADVHLLRDVHTRATTKHDKCHLELSRDVGGEVASAGLTLTYRSKGQEQVSAHPHL